MRRPLAALALVAVLNHPASAFQFEKGSRELKLAQLAAVSLIAQFYCSNVEPDAVVGDATIKSLGFEEKDLNDRRFAPDVNEFIKLYRADTESACRSFEVNFGPKGDLVRGLVKPRRTTRELAGRYPAGSPESKAALIIATSAFVRAHCQSLDVDSKAGATAISALGISREVLMGSALTPDVNLSMTIYKNNPKGCDLVLAHFGSNGDVIPYIVTHKAR